MCKTSITLRSHNNWNMSFFWILTRNLFKFQVNYIIIQTIPQFRTNHNERLLTSISINKRYYKLTIVSHISYTPTNTCIVSFIDNKVLWQKSNSVNIFINKTQPINISSTVDWTYVCLGQQRGIGSDKTEVVTYKSASISVKPFKP